MKSIIESPKGKLICIDIDGTICKGEMWEGMPDPEPLLNRIEYFNNLYKRGAHIIIYTARQPSMYQVTLAWLIKYGVMFHGVAMRIKPGADLYIDDKVINVLDLCIKDG